MAISYCILSLFADFAMIHLTNSVALSPRANFTDWATNDSLNLSKIK
jgi:hypothetical protein